MRDSLARVPNAGGNVRRLKIREFFEDLLWCQIICQQIQHVTDANPHSTDTRPSATLVWIHCHALFYRRCHSLRSFMPMDLLLKMDLSPFPRPVSHSISHQRSKSGLNEVLVAGQGIRDPVLAHDDKRNAVHQSPCLVGMILEKVKGLLEDFGIETNYFNFW